MSEFININNQNTNISFIIMCSNDVSDRNDFLKKFYEHVKTAYIHEHRESTMIEFVEKQLKEFATQYIRTSRISDDTTIAFVLFYDQQKSFRESYIKFRETNFSTTAEISDYSSDFDWRNI